MLENENIKLLKEVNKYKSQYDNLLIEITKK